MAAKKVCVIFGAGEKIGYSVARKWAGNGFRVVCSRRSDIDASVLSSLGADVTSVPCDVSKQEDVNALVEKVTNTLGPIHTVVYNAGSGVFKTYDKITPEEFDRSFNINVKGLLLVAQAVCPGMVSRGEGVLAITGATASLRGKPFTAAFAAAKGGQRNLAQALARDLGPKGVHVFYTIIDGIVGSSGDGTVNPDDIAEAYWTTAIQPRSCWTFEQDVRPFNENW